MVGIYVRVSTAEQAREGYSIGEQTERLKSYCSAMNWNDYRVYTDAGFSGANTNRPALQEMLRDVRAGIVSRVLVYKLDRLSRSQRDTLSLIEDEFLPNHCEFTSMNENFDTSTPFGRAAIGILAVFAQLEREQIKERMQMGADARAKEGKWHGGITPYGFRYDGELKVVPEEAAVIREVLEMYLSGLGTKVIAKILNDRGTLRRGYRWNDASVRRLLTNRTAVGELRHRGQWVDGNQNSAISGDLFERANTLLTARRKRIYEQNMRPGRATAVLTGFLYCAQCGERYAKWTARGYSYYRCRGRSACRNKTWRLADLDDLVLGEIAKIKTGDYTPAPAAPDPGYDAELQKVRKKISRLLDLYTEGVDLPEMRDRLGELSARAAELEGLIKEPPNRQNAADAVELVESFGDVIKSRDFGELRLLVDALIDRIVLDGEDVTIFWNFG